MGYKVRPTITIDLSELGEDAQGKPFFVEIKNPKILTYGEQMAIAETSQQFVNVETVDGVETKKMVISKESTVAMGKMAQSYIVSWNLIDKDTEKQISPFDEDALDHVPGEVVNKIFFAVSQKDVVKAVETKN